MCETAYDIRVVYVTAYDEAARTYHAYAVLLMTVTI